MKKLISLLLVVGLMASLLIVSASASSGGSGAIAGGWAAAESPEITEEMRALMDKAMEGLLGVDYSPVAYLGTQIVAGTNHCVLCQAKTVYPGAKPYYVLVYIHEDLNGGVEILDIKTLDVGEMLDALPEPEPEDGRQDGERFEAVIMLEGMEETVQYEHIRNDVLGFEIDYDYEQFERISEPDRELFVSRYDIPEDPQNYFEVTRSAGDTETVSASVGDALSKDYDIIVESFELDNVGSCIRIDASEARGGGGTPDLLQTIYIIPAAEGCLVATAHYTFESAEGFGARISNIMNTLAVLDQFL